MNTFSKNHLSKTVLITGASSGIGAELAKIYAKKGDQLILLARRISLVENLIDELKTQFPALKAFAFQCDVTKESLVKEVVKKAIKAFGKIDTVIANAGRGMGGNFETLTLDQHRILFETNLFGVLNTIYATLPYLKQSQGRLAILGSIMSYISLPKSSSYAMSKAALKSLADTLQLELKDFGISVTLICPGLVETQIRKVDLEGVYHQERQDPAPKYLMIGAEKAAQKIYGAIEKRKKEIIITYHGKLAVFLKRHFPRSFQTLLGQFY